MTGCEAGVLAPSTLHLLQDLAGLFARGGYEFAACGSCYPVTRWALERAAGLGARVQWFRHHDTASLRAVLSRCRKRPVVVTDGYCPACGAAPPLASYREEVRARGGWLLIDDTQALGIFGTPSARSPYGTGGGGSLRSHGLGGPDVIAVASLAKAFGAPLACLLGSADFVAAFEQESETRVHCSPPSTAAITAGLDALRDNRMRGDRTRARLLALVREFRSRLFAGGWRPEGGVFPMQSIACSNAQAVHRELLGRGVRTFTRRPHAGGPPRLGMIVNARIPPEDLAFAARELNRISLRRQLHGQRANA